jgi:hypothetical protein
MYKKLTATLLATIAIAVSANAAHALDLTCDVPPPDMDPHAVVALRITGQEFGATIHNLKPVYTLQNGEIRDRSVQYQKGWRVEPVTSSTGPAVMWQGYYGPSNHRVVAFVKPNDSSETYREDHYTDKGVLEHRDRFPCHPAAQVTYNAPAPAPTNNPPVAHNGWHQYNPDNPNPDELRMERQADQSNRRYENAQVDGLPDCGDANVWRVLMKVFSNVTLGHVDESLIKVLQPGTAQGTGIDRNSSAKLCRVVLRANEQVAHELDDGILGYHTMSQIAFEVNQAYNAGNPKVLNFKIQLNGEGGWVLHVTNS